MRFLIVGQGLAGSALAWRLLHAGASCLVVDRPVGETASRVAAGLVNPLTGRKVRPEWRQEECLPEADAYYRETERELGGSWWQKTPIWRETEGEEQEELWHERQHDPASAPYAGPLLPWPEGWSAPGRAAYTRGGAVLHAEALVNAMRSWLCERDCFREDTVEAQAVTAAPGDSGGCVWQGETYDGVIWCTGYEAASGLALPALESRLSKGTIVDVELPGFSWEAGVLHFGHWLVRRGNCWRLGATYEWSWAEPGVAEAAAVQELLCDLERRYEGEIRLVRARAAVRPIIRYSQPVAGPIPGRTGQYVFSGLGSRGVATSPWVARLLAAHLLEGAPLPEDVEPGPLWQRWQKACARAAMQGTGVRG